MAEVTINYKDAAIATMDASGTKTLQTQGKYCEGDIEVVYVKPGGGGAPANVEIGTFTVDSTANQVTVQHSFGHVPKMAFVFNTSTAWSPNALLCEELMSSPENGDFDISYSSSQRRNTVIGSVYNETTKQFYSSDTYTTYPASMTATEIVFATGRYYSIQFKPGYTYFYVIVG